MALPFTGNISAQQLADLLPSGIAIINSRDEAIFVNRRFEELAISSAPTTFDRWSPSIHEDDYSRVARGYADALRSQCSLREEYRIRNHRCMWRSVVLTPLARSELHHFNLTPDRDGRGGFICTMADITQEKTAELSQRKIAQEAHERKEQQERFIDMISHEVRNPLSAILHCTEDILEAIHNRDKRDIDVPDIATAADTISLCVAHQKKIIDDVLTFSKLDASMLSLSPRRVMPRRDIATSLTMFRPELRKHEIKFEYVLDQTYADCKVDWVLADMDRMAQVLINLLSNAIKFTAKSGDEKLIRVSMGAATERPASYPPDVVFFKSDQTALRMDATSSQEWGSGDTAYIMVAVKDSGIGISNEAQKRLFERFNQATPRTESIYGGSGLGLNVSRKLCHIHGGEIGVSSKEGEGSTFGFFFKVRRTAAPANDEPPRQKKDAIQELCSDIQKLGNELTGVNRDTAAPSIPEAPMMAKLTEATPGASDDRKEHTAQLSRQTKSGETVVTLPQSASGTSSLSSASASATNSEPPSSARHILLVEDNIINRQVLSRKLKSLGFRISEASNGQEALDSVQTHSFDCVLMDQVMPIMDGNEATRKIRDLEKRTKTHVPVLGVTANVREAQQADMMSAGMDDIIHKPYKTNDLSEKIDRMIRSRNGDGDGDTNR
ncbi:putative sensory transduction histidine kinase [Aspergillus steynii IBT 23096]|uniref:histidine kinase n=1 Tax=Aspergillus steynii IBT 23096 TaxID=1392250 RepID=A0A2I2G112_9EURO|nr:putative sensory transduction histidine kinase [Aspergillus steynii IBT 23096]PLB46563.1 putative sensory transduction histidine kinase [Aspergillus steynii IBT 23096]